MKSILIIEPNTTAGQYLIKTAKQMKLTIVAVTSKSLYENSYDDKTKKSIDHFIFCDFKNKNEDIDYIVTNASKLAVDGIVSGFEFFTDWAVEIAKKLNLPSNNDDNISAFRDKADMAKIFTKYGVPSAQTTELSADNEHSNITFPCIIKPSKNAGSFGVVKVNNKEELQAAIDIIKKNDIEFPHNFPLNSKVLCQEILYGPEISVEVVANRGVYTLITFTQKATTSGSYFAEIGHIVPAPIDQHESSTILDVVFFAMRVLGFNNGVAHAEVILSEEGPKIVEIGARLPGDYIPQLIEKALGVNEAELYINSALGNNIQVNQKSGIYAGINFLTVNKKLIFDKLVENNLSNNTLVKTYVKEGDIVGESHDNMSRVGHIVTTSTGYLKLIYKLKKERQKIRIIGTNDGK